MSRTICVAGKNRIAVDGLDYIFRRHADKNILFLPNRTDDGFDGWQPSLKRFADSRSVKQTTLEELYTIQDLTFISLEYEEIVKPSKFQSKELFNIHFSLLPKYKGMYTSTIPLLYGETRSGATLHKIDAGIDTGDIIDQIEFEVALTDNARNLYLKYLTHSHELFLRNIESIISRSYTAKSQTAIGSSYFSKRSIDYSAISVDFNKTAFEIHNQFRAFTFREYQIPQFNNWQIIRTEITNQKSDSKAGFIVEDRDDSFLVSSIDYNVVLYKDFYPMLWEAAKINDLAKLNVALTFVGDIDSLNKDGWSALILAAYNGSLSAVERLLERGASPTATNGKGTTALMYASSYYEKTKDKRMLQMLLDKQTSDLR